MTVRAALLGLAALAGLLAPARASDQALLDRALDTARARFAVAAPEFGPSLFGVDVAAYGEALALRGFEGVWGETVRADLAIRSEPSGSCGRYAAFVRMPPENGRVLLVLCPQFFTPGADGLRVLTILHEMVHVVAGRDECQAMAFAAAVEQAATGSFTPVAQYWQASGCAGGRYTLPR